MSESFIGRHSCFRVPIKAPSHKIDEGSIVSFQDPLQIFRSRLPYLILLVGDQDGCSVILEELFPSLARREYILVGYTAYFHHHGKLLHLILTWEERETDAELSHYAAEAPHVDSRGVWDTENDLWRSIEAGLDIGVNPFVLEARASKIDDLDA